MGKPTQVVEQVTVPQAPQAPQAPPAPEAPEQIVVSKNGKTVTVMRDGKLVIQRTEPSIAVPPYQHVPTIPPEAANISYAFFLMIAAVFIGTPLARAFARRMDRKAVAPAPSADAERLTRIEQSLEAVALEVERIGEGQRYVTQLMSSRDPVRVGGGNA